MDRMHEEEKKPDNASVIILLVILALAVILVDETPVRVAISFVPALLLAQRAMEAGGGSRINPTLVGPERRADKTTRQNVDDLLAHVREFYLTVHLHGHGKMDQDQVLAQTSQLEKKLNRLLAEVSDAADAPSPERA